MKVLIHPFKLHKDKMISNRIHFLQLDGLITSHDRQEIIDLGDHAGGHMIDIITHRVPYNIDLLRIARHDDNIMLSLQGVNPL